MLITIIFKDIDLKVQAKTIHASKGLEAEAVFILGLTNGEEGFPNVWQEDRIFSVIKSRTIMCFWKKNEGCFMWR